MGKASFLRQLVVAAALAVGLAAYSAPQNGGTFTTGNGTFLLDGKPFIVKAAELHYPRIPREYWEHRIRMCRALGMNTICMYVFWNLHEQREGVFDFTGQNDIAEFCRLAQKNGMYVIVRPGPYVCAEWEMGGLPWWLLKKKDIRLREQDPYFMERVSLFMNEVGKQLAPLTIQNGGPIIMVQVENEYGSYGEDKAYVSAIRDIVRRAGFGDATLFQCDWASNFTKNGLDDLVWTMNFGTGSNIDDQFSRLRELRPTSPLMCSEFWSGWFDKWGARHETRPADDMVAGIDEMLSKGISFSLYMTHGGTSFGHWAGANSPGFAPDVTSYDYDAPINEYGQPTEKFYKLRDVMRKYADSPLPDVPQPAAPLITIPEVTLSEHAQLMLGTDSIYVGGLRTFEDMDMGWGQMLYCASLPETHAPSTLLLDGCHDYGRVFVNGKYAGTVNRLKGEKSITLPPIPKHSTLAVLVEGMGRINFGRAIKDSKGLTGEVTLTEKTDKCEAIHTFDRWAHFRIPDDYARAETAFMLQSRHDSLEHGHAKTPEKEQMTICGTEMPAYTDDDMKTAGYYRGYFNLDKTGDTFLNMESWGKGQVYVNGHAIGRFWSIGPQQTLYVPGCWLKEGRNEIVVLDVIGPQRAVVRGQDKPELDKLQLENDLRNGTSGSRPDLKKAVISASGRMADKRGWQTIGFGSPAKGRYIAIECLNAQGGGNAVSIAEVHAKGSDGTRIDRSNWSTSYADSEDIDGGNHTGDKAFDLQESTYWSTAPGKAAPHLLVIDMGTEHEISALEYLPCIVNGGAGGINEYRIYVY